MSKRPQRKVRVDFRKNRDQQARRNDLTRDVHSESLDLDHVQKEQRVSGKGSQSRKRTIVGDIGDGDQVVRAVDESVCRPGRVLSAIGATQCTVQADDGRIYECTVRRVLRSLSRDARNVVVTGDKVLFQPQDEKQGVIERVEPRTGIRDMEIPNTLMRAFGHMDCGVYAQVIAGDSARERMSKYSSTTLVAKTKKNAYCQRLTGCENGSAALSTNQNPAPIKASRAKMAATPRQ